MRALIAKEIREGFNVVLFGGLLSALVMGLYAFIAVPLKDPQGGADFCNVLLALLPPALGVAAGSVLFAREKATGTLPLLLALPFSRGRIWWAKVSGGLVLAAGATLFFAIPVLLVVPRNATGMTVGPFLPDIAALVLLGFALATLCSTLAERPFSALLVGVFGLVALVLAALYVVAGLGGRIVGYDPMSDVSLWGLLTVAPLLLGSAAALKHGDLLFRGRKWVVGLSAAALAFAFVFALAVGVVRVATRYQRSKVTALGRAEMTSGTPVVALRALGPLTDLVHARWPVRRSGLSDQFHRSSHLVLLSAETGKELLVRRALEFPYAQVVVSPDGRYAAILAPPEPLTWAAEGSGGEARLLSVWDLQHRRLLYRGLPQRALGAQGPPEIVPSRLAAASWSPEGEWLAVVTENGPRYLLTMRPDGSEIRATTLAPELYGLSSQEFAWDPSGKALYFLGGDLSLVRWSLPEGKKETVWRPERSANRVLGGPGELSVSPDGERLAMVLSGWIPEPGRPVASEDPKQQERLPRSWVIVIAADGSSVKEISEDGISSDPNGSQLTWSSDSRRLYFVAPDAEGRSGRFGGWSRLVSWVVGDQTAKPVAGADRPFYPKLATSPKTGDLVVWNWTGEFVTIDEQGRVERPSAAVNKVTGSSEFLGLDSEGRALILDPRKPSFSRMDLHSGDLKQIYP